MLFSFAGRHVNEDKHCKREREMYVHKVNRYRYMCINKYIYIYMYMYMYMYVEICIYIYICMYVCRYVGM